MPSSTQSIPAASPRHREGWFSLIAVTLGALMPGLSTTIAAVANSDIAHDLQVGLADLQWITTAYLIVILRAIQGVFGGFLTTNAVAASRQLSRITAANGDRYFQLRPGAFDRGCPILGGLIVQSLGRVTD